MGPALLWSSDRLQLTGTVINGLNGIDPLLLNDQDATIWPLRAYIGLLLLGSTSVVHTILQPRHGHVTVCCSSASLHLAHHEGLQAPLTA